MFNKKQRAFKILLVSDVEILKKFPGNEIKKKFKKVDFIICAGDVSNSYLDYLFTTLNRDIIYVNGNHVWQIHHDISFCKNLDGKTLKYRGINFLGFDGSKCYSYGEHQYSEKEMTRKFLFNIFKLIFKKPDIVVSHAPPRHVHDKEDFPHQGFEIFNKIIKSFKPKLWVHGHVHLNSHIDTQESIVERTRVVNAYGYKIIDFKL